MLSPKRLFAKFVWRFIFNELCILLLLLLLLLLLFIGAVSVKQFTVMPNC